MAPAVAASSPVDPEVVSKGNVVPSGALVISESERQLAGDMREALTAEGINADEIRDLDLVRFLRARAGSVPKAVRLLADDLKWRQEYLGSGIDVAHVEAEMKANKSYLVSREGLQPWIYLFARNHDSTTRDMETLKKFSIFVLEKTLEKFSPGVEQFGCVLDLGEAQYKNLDGRGMIAIFEVLAAHYPDRMQVLYLIHVPYIFWGVWKVVKPFIDNRIKQKIVFLEDSNFLEVFAEKIPKALLPKEYGGEAELQGLWELYGNEQQKLQ